MSKHNRLHLRFEGIDVDAHKAKMPPSDDPNDAYCPNCRAVKMWTFTIDIVQHGMMDDKIVSVMWCRVCGHYSYLSYIIEHDLIDFGD